MCKFYESRPRPPNIASLHDPSGLQVLILQHPYGFSGGARNAVCYPL